MEKAIYFDCDGTIVDLYNVEDWLFHLHNYSVYPYVAARPLVNMSSLARLLNRLQKNGYIIGIITWCSKGSNDDFDARTQNAKLQWLRRHLPSVNFNEIHIVQYGIEKSSVANYPNGILFDDNAAVRKSWSGVSHDENGIIDFLKELVKRD